MNIFHTLSDFLFDKNNFIALFDDKVYIYRYRQIKDIKDNKIILGFDDYILSIIGNGLKIIKLKKEELLIKGNISEVKKDYE